MGTPPTIPYRGRRKWTDVAVTTCLAVLGGLLAWGVLTQEPGQYAPMRALATFTAVAAAATAALTLAQVVTRQLPPLRWERREGRDVASVHAWPGDWWHANVLDLGLGLLGATLAVMGVRAGRDWLVAGLVVGVVGAWFAVRVLLAVLGRRHNEALHVTGDAVVHESARGTARCARDQVVTVRARGESLVLLSATPVEVTACPRPWRLRRGRGTARTMVVDCSLMGHEARDLARWLESVVVERAAAPPR